MIGSITINEPAVLSINAIINNASCYGDTGSSTINPYGGTSPYAYSWSSGDSTQTVSLLAGTYSVLIIDSNNCILTDSIIIGQADSIVIISIVQYIAVVIFRIRM